MSSNQPRDDEEVPAPPPGGGPKPYPATEAVHGPEMTAGAMGRPPGLPPPGHAVPPPEGRHDPTLRLPGDEEAARYTSPQGEQSMEEPRGKEEPEERQRPVDQPGRGDQPGLTDERTTEDAPQPPPSTGGLGGGAVAGPGYIAGREPRKKEEEEE